MDSRRNLGMLNCFGWPRQNARKRPTSTPLNMDCSPLRGLANVHGRLVRGILSE
jgi:hypothetical protein